MLELVGEALPQRLGEGIRAGKLSDQAAAIGRLFSGTSAIRKTTIEFELAGSTGAGWLEEEGELVHAGNDLLMRQVACIGGGTTEMARNVISERVLGMPRERSHDPDLPFRDVPKNATGRER
jgi:alkylation response protein AidB-like acyl-CoA dehydrogenase